MRKLFILFCLTGAALLACAPKPLPTAQFDGQTYVLAFSAREQAGYINEYLLPEEDLETYSKMIGVYSFPQMKGISAQKAAEQMAQLMQLKNPQAPFDIHVSAEADAALVDFLVFSTGGTMAEYNVFKYMPDGEGLKAVQFVARWYATQSKDALKNARDFAQTYLGNRQEWVKKVDNMAFPALYKQAYLLEGPAAPIPPSAKNAENAEADKLGSLTHAAGAATGESAAQ